MKVTFCTWDKPDFCIAQNIWLKRLLPELRQRGIECQVLFLTIGQPEECPTVQALQKDGFICHATANLGSTRNFVRWILKKLAHDPPDVFVPHHVLLAYYAGRWVREAGVPTIGVLHSEDSPCQGLVENFGSVDSPFHVSAFVGVSLFIEKMARKKVIGNVLVERIPCGAPLPSLVSKYPSGPFRLVYVGRLVEEAKRISEVTRSLCRAVREIPHVEAIIYGEGSARQSVEQILMEEGDDLPVWLAGPLENEKIQKHLAKCHGFVLLSDYEGTPIALMEAMACGLVPICLRIRGGVEELIEDGVTGVLVDDREEGFVSAVRGLREAPDKWARLSRAARAKIEREFSTEVCTDRWEVLLRKLYQKGGYKHPIKIPLLLDLPPIHPKLAKKDPRKPLYLEVPVLIRYHVRRFLWCLKEWVRNN